MKSGQEYAIQGTKKDNKVGFLVSRIYNPMFSDFIAGKGKTLQLAERDAVIGSESDSTVDRYSMDATEQEAAALLYEWGQLPRELPLS